jgi:antitoxin YefM
VDPYLQDMGNDPARDWPSKSSSTVCRPLSAHSGQLERTGTQIRYLSGTIKPYLITEESATVAISASEARSRLFPLIQQVNDDHVPVRISSKSGDAVLLSAEDFDSWQETIYLLRSPANARRLMEAVARDKSGEAPVVKTMEELEALAGE